MSNSWNVKGSVLETVLNAPMHVYIKESNKCKTTCVLASIKGLFSSSSKGASAHYTFSYVMLDTTADLSVILQ